MRIRVKETVDQRLFQVGAKQFFGEFGAVDLHQSQWTQRRDLLPGNIVHCQHARGRKIIDWLGNHNSPKTA